MSEDLKPFVCGISGKEFPAVQAQRYAVVHLDERRRLRCVLETRDAPGSDYWRTGIVGPPGESLLKELIEKGG